MEADKVKQAVIAELYKRHPSLGARSIDEFADFVAALGATPTPSTQPTLTDKEIQTQSTGIALEYARPEFRIRCAQAVAALLHCARVSQAAPTEPAGGAQPIDLAKQHYHLRTGRLANYPLELCSVCPPSAAAAPLEQTGFFPLASVFFGWLVHFMVRGAGS